MSKSKKLPLVYLASAYSYKSWIPFVSRIVKYFRYKAITKIAAEITKDKKVALICPITQSHHIGKHIPNNDGGFAQWKDIDLTYISHCDELWVATQIEGWENSVGVQAEIKFARKKKIPVKFLYDEV